MKWKENPESLWEGRLVWQPIEKDKAITFQSARVGFNGAKITVRTRSKDCGQSSAAKGKRM